MRKVRRDPARFGELSGVWQGRIEEARMFLMGLGALLIFGGVLYMARSTIWRGSLSGPGSSRPVRGTLEPPRRGLGFLGFGSNWPGLVLMALGAALLMAGSSF
jgi:hypothetical protein